MEVEALLEAYESHLAKFRGTDVVIAEVSIYSGGSLRMWREYFGPKATMMALTLRQAASTWTA